MRSALARVRRVRATVATLAPFARPHRRYLVEGTLATVVLVAARLAFPWPLRGLMEIVFHKGAHSRGAAVASLVPRIGDPVWWLVGSFVAIILIWGLSESVQRLTFTRFAVGLVRDSRAAALAAIPAAAAGDRGPGDLMAAVTGDAARVKSGVKTILIGTSRNAGFFLGVTVIVSLIDPLIGLVFFAGGLATVVVAALGAWRSARIARRSRRRESGLTDDLHRHFAEGRALPSTLGARRNRPDSKLTRVEGMTTFAVHAVLAVSTCAVLLLAIDGGRSGRLSPGSVFTILSYVLLMHNKTVGFGRRITRSGRLFASADRLASLVAHGGPRTRDGLPLATLESRTEPPAPRLRPKPLS